MAKRGAPTKYNPDFARQAEVACAEGGFTGPKLAKLFGVARSTINEWMVTHQNFSDAIKKGKEAWDNLRVEDSLLKRSLGYKYDETTKEPSIDDPKKLITTKVVKKEVAADTTAMIFWLKNRQPQRWRDVKGVEVSGKDGAPIETKNMTAKEISEIYQDAIRDK